MKNEIQSSWIRLDQKLNDITSLLSENEDWLMTKTDNEWTLLEILHHLFLTEKMSLQYLEYKLEKGGKPKDLSWFQSLKFQFMKRYLRSSRSAKAPSLVDPRSPNVRKTYHNLSALIEDFQQLRSRFKSFLNEKETAYLKKGIFKNPIVGYMSATRMMEFFEEHFDRHRRQTDRRISRLKG